MPATPDIRISHDSHTWAAAAAEFVQALGQEAVEAKGQFFIALSGGRTPETPVQSPDVSFPRRSLRLVQDHLFFQRRTLRPSG